MLWEHGPRGDKEAKARGKLGNPTKPKLRCREVGVSAASRLSPPAFTLRCRILILTGLPCLLVLTVNVKVAAEARDTFGLQQLPPRIASRLQKFRRQAKRQGGSNQSVRCVPVAGRGPERCDKAKTCVAQDPWTPVKSVRILFTMSPDRQISPAAVIIAGAVLN